MQQKLGPDKGPTGAVMNENVWDLVTIQQALQPGFMPPYPQTIPKICWCTFLTTFNPKTLGKTKQNKKPWTWGWS